MRDADPWSIRPPWMPMIAGVVAGALIVASAFFGACASWDMDCRVDTSHVKAQFARIW
jgi:hypothetical protein